MLTRRPYIQFDSGDFPKIVAKAAKNADYAGLLNGAKFLKHGAFAALTNLLSGGGP